MQADRAQGPDKVEAASMLRLLIGQLEAVGTDLLWRLLACSCVEEAEERSKRISQLRLDVIELLDHAWRKQDALHGFHLQLGPSSQPVPLAEELVGLFELLAVLGKVRERGSCGHTEGLLEGMGYLLPFMLTLPLLLLVGLLKFIERKQFHDLRTGKHKLPVPKSFDTSLQEFLVGDRKKLRKSCDAARSKERLVLVDLVVSDISSDGLQEHSDRIELQRIGKRFVLDSGRIHVVDLLPAASEQVGFDLP
mmetsp:Transcript_25833/g.58185  ORF Transcript_25833/g.58185 Transcript_25833/m.58185 type:complete len:250 (-) Transcript_25833:294-1043(-)